VLRVFTGTQLPSVLAEVRRTMGEHACVVDVTCDNGRVEVVASEIAVTAHPFHPPRHNSPVVRTAVEEPDPLFFRAPVAPGHKADAPTAPAAQVPPVAAPRGARPRPRPGRIRPPIIAVVGPTGAGKTTTIAKLATNPKAYGRGRVGLIGLDTYRVGAVEQLETYAQLAGLPYQIVYESSDIEPAVRRLVECDVILVDTPGRGPRQSEDLATVRDWFERLDPDEVHLALPASLMPHVIRRTMQQFRVFGVTHALCTKLDECPLDSRVFDVVAREGYQMRWYTDGQEVPADIQAATGRMEAAKAHIAARRIAVEAFA
jgi:flagellar biosynthesis protein FlhF